MNTRYKATIHCMTEVDDFEKGYTGESGTSWDHKVEANTFTQLIEEVCEFVNCRNPDDLHFEEINDYSWGTEAWYDYHADVNNCPADAREIELWKQGKMKLWDVCCHIIFSQVVERKFDVKQRIASQKEVTV